MSLSLAIVGIFIFLWICPTSSLSFRHVTSCLKLSCICFVLCGDGFEASIFKIKASDHWGQSRTFFRPRPRFFILDLSLRLRVFFKDCILCFFVAVFYGLRCYFLNWFWNCALLMLVHRSVNRCWGIIVSYWDGLNVFRRMRRCVMWWLTISFTRRSSVHRDRIFVTSEKSSTVLLSRFRTPASRVTWYRCAVQRMTSTFVANTCSR